MVQFKKNPYPGLELGVKLGSGGQGTVYRALYNGVPVAAKVFEKRTVDGFATELASLLASGTVRPHQHLARLIRFYNGKHPCLVTEYVEGKTLFHYLQTHGAINRYEARKIAAEIASGLCHLHAHGIVHRDFKSLNVMMASGSNDIINREVPKPVVIDLGTAGVRPSLVSSPQLGQAEGCFRDHRMALTTAWGSLRWMTPEVLKEQRWSDKTDTYAFGIVYWEMLSGQVPFDDPSMSYETLVGMIIEGVRPSMTCIHHAGSEAIRLIERCWDPNPSRRPSMFDVMCLLQRKDGVAIFRQADLRGANSIDFGAFCYMCDNYAPRQVPRSDMHMYFEAINIGGTGQISFQEFSKFFWGWEHLNGNTADRRSRETGAPTLPRALQRLRQNLFAHEHRGPRQRLRMETRSPRAPSRSTTE